MNDIRFQCPYCYSETELSLETQAAMLFLNCPECQGPLMYFSGRAFEMDSEEFLNLQKRLKSLKGSLKIRRTGNAQHRAGEPIRAQAISSEDIANLLIDLETSEDVDDFLRRLR
jgi:uncharacterized protein YbaR (Trm112 family)